MKKPIEIIVKLKCLPGDKCIALNYRCRPAQWENGVVISVTTRFREDSTYDTSYEVLLDRKTTTKSRFHPFGGASIFITVGDDAITRII